MENLTNLFVSPLPDSPYVKPFRLNYTQNGMAKTWDVIEVHDSVTIIIFNVSKNVLVMVKQFRPGIIFALYISIVIYTFFDQLVLLKILYCFSCVFERCS